MQRAHHTLTIAETIGRSIIDMNKYNKTTRIGDHGSLKYAFLGGHSSLSSNIYYFRPWAPVAASV
jgi:hypothetical protein